MKTISKFFKYTAIILFIASIIIFSAIIYLHYNTASEYKVLNGEKLQISTKIPVTVKYTGENDADAKLYNTVGAEYNVKLNIFGIIPAGETNVKVVDDMYVEVLGTPFGMKIYIDGVLVVALSDVDTAYGNSSPATKCGLKVGDYIISLDGIKVYTNEDVSKIIEESGGRSINVIINRNGKILPLTLTPEISVTTGAYKAGIWVRDSSAGIGTLTFYYPYNNVICGLGHGICDKDTGNLLSVNSGELVGAEIISLKKAVSGNPGELTGRITLLKYGDILLNSNCGVYANTTENIKIKNQMPIALKQEIKNGDAVILTTVSGYEPREYSCTVKIYNGNGEQNLIVKITDENLLSATGGIVQGMSGSPIIQNGKLIGAVTHVLIDDPTKGYGIFAETMLETAKNINGQVKNAS